VGERAAGEVSDGLPGYLRDRSPEEAGRIVNQYAAYVVVAEAGPPRACGCPRDPWVFGHGQPGCQR
jgi:hypothetical protein